MEKEPVVSTKMSALAPQSFCLSHSPRRWMIYLLRGKRLTLRYLVFQRVQQADYSFPEKMDKEVGRLS